MRHKGLPVTVDCETLRIADRPRYPPPAVGVSVKYPGKRARYYAFGHPTGNDATWGEARAAVEQAYAHPDGVLFQNGKFDLDVIEVEWNLAPPPWDRVHDTMFLLFLDDPHQRQLGLKESAERLLGQAPEERDAVNDWLVERQPLKRQGVRLNHAKNGKNYAGAYLAFAPGDLVGAYANGDTERTEALFRHLYPSIVGRGMRDAYDRERRLAPILLRMERRGIAVDQARLEADVAVYEGWSAKLDAWIVKRLKAPADVNLDSGPQLVAALLAAGLADEALLGVTATGRIASNKDALMDAVTDKTLLAALKYRAQLATALGTFMKAWARMARATGGLIHTSWNQVKAPRGGELGGTRTGRLSATWFMNMPKRFEAAFRDHEPDVKRQAKLPRCPLKGLPALPRCRSYVVPFDGHVLIDRDYSQQEPRIMAHFENGALMAAYNADPWIDLHDSAKAELEKVGLFYERKPVKNTNLGLIYGMGVGKLAMKNDMGVEEARTLKDAILELYPGLKDLYKDMKQRAAANEPIHTWGGREYYCEPPMLVNGRWVKFDYKMVNVLIQGSAADCTKEAIIVLDDALAALGRTAADWHLILNVHDQLTMSVPRRDRDAAMKVLKIAMEGVAFDVPMLSEGATSAVNWDDLQPYDTKGARA